jgi:hypothetical protein
LMELIRRGCSGTKIIHDDEPIHLVPSVEIFFAPPKAASLNLAATAGTCL